MALLFDNFEEWKKTSESSNSPLFQAVLDFEIDQKGKTEKGEERKEKREKGEEREGERRTREEKEREETEAPV